MKTTRQSNLKAKYCLIFRSGTTDRTGSTISTRILQSFHNGRSYTESSKTRFWSKILTFQQIFIQKYFTDNGQNCCGQKQD